MPQGVNQQSVVDELVPVVVGTLIQTVDIGITAVVACQLWSVTLR